LASMTNGEYIMRELLKQVFRPKELNASKLISSNYGGKAEESGINGFSKPAVAKRSKKIRVLLQKWQAEFEVFLMCTEKVSKSVKIEVKPNVECPKELEETHGENNKIN